MSLAELCLPASEQMSIASLSMLPWLTDYLLDAGDLRKVQILPLTSDSEQSFGASQPAAILLHDRDVSGSIDRQMLQALTSTWSGAIGAAVLHDAARRLSERLAASNRSLAEAQRQLAEAESMARLGEMAAGAAHEMNNPLTVISGRAQLLAARLSGAETHAAAEAIVGATGQLSDLITSMRLLASPPLPEFRLVSADEVIRHAIEIARRRTGVQTPIEAHFPRDSTAEGASGGAPSALLDKDLMTTALAEVLANALQASNNKPVFVRAHTTGADRRLLFVTEDNGAGMSTKALQHAFDPFFSERPAGRGTGLGLTRARRLVELHEGEIFLESRSGQGTTVTISVPTRLNTQGGV
jgi:signal transduction histidine kinase